jgi:uncharacterized protein
MRKLEMTSNFNPPFLLRNTHTQTILNSFKLRRPIVKFRAKGMLKASKSHILDCGDGVRLCGYYSGHGDGKRDLCILIHGWLGSSDSMYMLSAAGRLWDRGFDVFRLNLRDHGDTQHLNKEMFHSCRINEVVGAVKQIQESFPNKRLVLGGFSLGGNFAMRVAVRAPKAGIRIDQVVAICPVLYPPSTIDAMENGPAVYHHYFLKKWIRAMAVKQKAFPEIKELAQASGFKSIRDMTDYFVRHFTGYPDLDTYLNGYAITGDVLSSLTIPATMINSLDDPIIPSKDIACLAAPASLQVRTPAQGGHCGFLQDMRLTSWADERMAELFQSPT